MSNAGAPVTFEWDGEAMRPSSPFWAHRADKEYVIGQKYRLVEHHERSTNTHNHFFAQVAEAHANLPQHWADLLPTPEHLRKYALIRAGYCDANIITTTSNEAAATCAAMVRRLDEFAVVDVRGSLVHVFFAKSQSYRTMDKAEFQRSKEAVLEVIAAMIRVEPGELEANAGRAA